MFVPRLALTEIVLRGSIMYLAMLMMLRFLGRRQAGSFARADLLVIIVISDAAQNGLGNYQSVTEGVILVFTIIGWDYLLDRLAFHYPLLARMIESPPLILIYKGKILRRNLRAEMLTTEELMSQLREQGIEDIAKVRCARLEGDGRISIIREA